VIVAAASLPACEGPEVPLNAVARRHRQGDIVRPGLALGTVLPGVSTANEPGPDLVGLDDRVNDLVGPATAS
jgi:hypothetical protein